MTPRQLSTSAHAILALVALRGPSTPYDLKAALGHLTAQFWSVPHTQVYRETERLAHDGLLAVERDHGGRHRRVYTATDRGLEVLREWLREPTPESMEIRDLAQLKLLASELLATPDIERLAREQAEVYARRLAELDALERRFADRPELALRMLAVPLGRAVFEAARDFWAGVAERPPDVSPRRS